MADTLNTDEGADPGVWALHWHGVMEEYRHRVMQDITRREARFLSSALDPLPLPIVQTELDFRPVTRVVRCESFTLDECLRGALLECDEPTIVEARKQDGQS